MAGDRPSHVLAVPKWTLIIYAIQLLLAITILGLSAYGIHWIDYNVLIYGLVCALCTIGVCIYFVVSTLFAHKGYNMWAFLALHIWMVIFWLVQFSLVGNLARIWAAPTCAYDPYYGSYCYRKRDMIEKRDTTTYGAYWGALVAGAVFGAFEFALWVVLLVILGIYIHRHRMSGSPTSAPPTYTAPSNGQAVPMEKFGATAQVQQTQYPASVQTPTSQYAQPVQQQQQGQSVQQPPQVYSQTTGPQFTTPYTQQQDPVNRQATISPVTSAGGYSSPPQSHAELASISGYSSPPQNHAELASPQHTGNYNPNAVELQGQK